MIWINDFRILYELSNIAEGRIKIYNKLLKNLIDFYF